MEGGDFVLTLEEAKKAAEAAHKKAESLGIAICVTIVDEHGTLILSSRDEKSFVVSHKFAFSKAYTAAIFGMPSGDIAPFAQEGKPYQGITDAFAGEFMVLAGGVPVKKGNKVVGAVGVGGSTDPLQDAECAKAAADLLSKD